ncbi:cyclodeaminase/cyclohydrolase family protein, partial [candidate division WOR-3 bacterium]|nr:cyclodeaminase/cyclohydrolase family protein [candidate division WOR-3 bacterium]MCK4673406.1 cyclodeaminase/cyclohydrolase family protein [candidate division WOR-3 bacterium]
IAAQVPFEVCKKILFIYPYAKILAQKGLKNVISDVGVALYSLHSGFMAARVNVLINLNSIVDTEFNESVKIELDSFKKQEQTFYQEIENIFLTKL